MLAYRILGLSLILRHVAADPKRYASWVQNVVRQFGPYLRGRKGIWRLPSTNRTGVDGPPATRLSTNGTAAA